MVRIIGRFDVKNVIKNMKPFPVNLYLIFVDEEIIHVIVGKELVKEWLVFSNY